MYGLVVREKFFTTCSFADFLLLFSWCSHIIHLSIRSTYLTETPGIFAILYVVLCVLVKTILKIFFFFSNWRNASARMGLAGKDRVTQRFSLRVWMWVWCAHWRDVLGTTPRKSSLRAEKRMSSHREKWRKVKNSEYMQSSLNFYTGYPWDY